MLQVPSIKQCHLMGPRRYAFSDIASASRTPPSLPALVDKVKVSLRRQGQEREAAGIATMLLMVVG